MTDMLMDHRPLRLRCAEPRSARNERRAIFTMGILSLLAIGAAPPVGHDKAEKEVSKAPLSKAPLKEIVKVGAPAPDFRLRAMDGTMVRLSELSYPGRDKKYSPKRPVFLDFFRTDCTPCLEAMPELVALHQKYSASGLHIVLIALLEDEDGRAKLDRYLAEKKLPFAVVVDANQHFAKQYLGDVVTLPATFLIDRDGVLKMAKYGATGTYQDHFGSTIDAVLAAHTEASAAGKAEKK